MTSDPCSVQRPRSRGRETCPKLCGADVELGNFVLGSAHEASTYEASSAVLAKVEGYPRRLATSEWARTGESYAWSRDDSWHRRVYGGSRPDDTPSPYEPGAWRDYGEDGGAWGRQSYGQLYNPQDYARRWLPNGSCVYGDLGHVEVCIPECRSAFDAVTYFHAMLAIVRGAQVKANVGRDPSRHVVVTVNNSDGHGNSWGGHTNIAVTSDCFGGLFERRLHHALFLASFLASSIVYTGAGKAGSENDRPDAPFLLTQRGDFYERLVGIQTTYNRPLVNMRDEPLAGSAHDVARVHCIFFDSTLMHMPALLRFGTMQLVLAMIEQGIAPTELILEDPLEALEKWNRDPDFRLKASTITGVRYTAVEYQAALLEWVHRFTDAGGADDIVPRWSELLAVWDDTVDKLRHKDFAALIGRIEWLLKHCVLERAMTARGLSWTSPEIKALDHLFSSLDPQEGLYWHYERAGVVERIASEDEIEHAVSHPPDDTRSWLRGVVLSKAGESSVDIDFVDWDRIEYSVRHTGKVYAPARRRVLRMSDPFAQTKRECLPALQHAGSLDELLELAGAEDGRDQPRSWLLPAVATVRNALPCVIPHAPAREAGPNDGIHVEVEEHSTVRVPNQQDREFDPEPHLTERSRVDAPEGEPLAAAPALSGLEPAYDPGTDEGRRLCDPEHEERS